MVTAKKRAAEEIDWSKWWPFKRAEGEALRQLKREGKANTPKPHEGLEEALM